MIFNVQMKDPDTLYDAIEEAVKEEIAKINVLDEDERSSLINIRKHKVGSIANKWFEYGEYLTVQIDTEAGTCVVLEAKE